MATIYTAIKCSQNARCSPRLFAVTLSRAARDHGKSAHCVSTHCMSFMRKLNDFYNIFCILGRATYMFVAIERALARLCAKSNAICIFLVVAISFFSVSLLFLLIPENHCRFTSCTDRVRAFVHTRLWLVPMTWIFSLRLFQPATSNRINNNWTHVLFWWIFRARDTRRKRK